MTNVSSYNSGGCGGCGGGGGNAYPAFSRLFVSEIEPCSRNGTINLNEGQVLIDGTADKTTITGAVDMAGPITTRDLTVSDGTKDFLVVSNGEVNIDGLMTVYGNITHQRGDFTSSGNIEAKDINSLTTISAPILKANDIDIGYFDQVRFRSDENQMGFDVTDEDGNTVTHLNNIGITTTAIATNSIIVNGSLTVDSTTLKVDPSTNRVGINTATPREALDVIGNIKTSGTIENSEGILHRVDNTATAISPSNNLTLATTFPAFTICGFNIMPATSQTCTLQLGYGSTNFLASGYEGGTYAGGTNVEHSTGINLWNGAMSNTLRHHFLIDFYYSAATGGQRIYNYKGSIWRAGTVCSICGCLTYTATGTTNINAVRLVAAGGWNTASGSPFFTVKNGVFS